MRDLGLVGRGGFLLAIFNIIYDIWLVCVIAVMAVVVAQFLDYHFRIKYYIKELEAFESTPRKTLFIVPDKEEVLKKLNTYSRAFRGDPSCKINRSNSTITFHEEVFYIRAASNPDGLRGFNVDKIVVQDSHKISDYKEIKMSILMPTLMRTGGELVEL